MDKEVIKTVEEFVIEFTNKLEAEEMDKAGKVLSWDEVQVSVNGEFEAFIFQEAIDIHELAMMSVEEAAELLPCKWGDITPEELIAKASACIDEFGSIKKMGFYTPQRISLGFIDSEAVERDYFERVAYKPARIVSDLDWRPSINDDGEYTGEIYLELVEE